MRKNVLTVVIAMVFLGSLGSSAVIVGFAVTATRDPIDESRTDMVVSDSQDPTADAGVGDLLERQGLVVARGPEPFDSHEAGSPSVLLDEGVYKMWYAASDGGTWQIAYATSSDGRSWMKHGVVLSPSLVGEGFTIAYAEVLRVGGGFRMWYTGNDGSYARIFEATSPDGIAWTKKGVAFDVNSPGSRDDRFVYDPTLVIVDGTFYMWYSGLSWADFHARVFLATSPDGTNWTRHGVVLTERPPGELDDQWAYAASVRRVGPLFQMVYTGYDLDGGFQRLFFAESADGFVWTNRRLALDVLAPDEYPTMGFPTLAIAPDGSWLVYYPARGVQLQIFLATRPPPGLLRVTTAIDLDPGAGVPGKILVDGIPRDEWGLTWLKLGPGEHRISFSDVPGLGTPDAFLVNVTPGQVTNVTGVYQSYGFLRVTTEPAVAATISVDGVRRNDWGVWIAVPPGTYQVAFGEVDGYRPPRPQTATVLAEQTTHIVGAYRATPGARGPDPSTYGLLRVMTALDDRRFGVPSQVLVDGIPRDEWGLTWVKLSPGIHTVGFTDVPSLGTPNPQRVEVTAGGTTEVTAVFQVHGFLRVQTDPSVPSTISVDGIPRNDWGMWQSMTPGTYAVSFGDVPDFVAPPAQTAIVRAGELSTIFGRFEPGPPGIAPTAAFEVVAVDLPRRTVSVDGSGSHDPDGDIVSYAWTWGDGLADNASATPFANHSYAADGEYTITLTVTDALGYAGTASRTITILAASLSEVILAEWEKTEKTRLDNQMGRPLPPTDPSWSYIRDPLAAWDGG